MRYSAIEIIQIISALFIACIGFYISIYNIKKILKNKQAKIKINFLIIFILLVASVSLFIYTILSMNSLYNTWVLLNWLSLSLEALIIILISYLLFFSNQQKNDC
ncbi:hypothetical protein [Mesoplasma tabanidae]|uniref:Uncharacterized protein n=1 Tax=Mesoplasma tabanidae TaxID=219745 RepID=A0A2K8P4X4_9MOLU|nr:hypothetical protein [Mesoplasma tabanidae]ATZ21801.1 hypothetical protein MTABA_v1c06090 [Mesoplasma tabanidae]